jgi:AcrR family transcriptional regulator
MPNAKSVADHDEPQLVVRNGTPARIKAEAVKLFGLKGFPNSTMREIMLACELTPGAFYNHFKSKEELLYRIIMDAHDQLDAAITESLDNAGPEPPTRLASLTYAFSKWHCENAELARVANRDYAELAGDMHRHIMQRRRELLEEFVVLVRNGQDQGAFSLASPSARGVRLAALSLVEMLVAISTWFRVPGPWKADEVAEFYVGLVTQMVGPTNGGKLSRRWS